MSTVAEIEAVLPRRANGVIYNDKYGVVTEGDLIASADEAFQAYDKAVADDTHGCTR
jgi:hypothetical protein